MATTSTTERQAVGCPLTPSVIGNPTMPYLNSLLDRGVLLTNFYAKFHPSQPDYFALTTGQSFYTKEGT